MPVVPADRCPASKSVKVKVIPQQQARVAMKAPASA